MGKPSQQRCSSRSLRRRMACRLFVEEMTKAILESGQLKEVDGHYELTGSFSTFAIPATLQDSLDGTSGSVGDSAKSSPNLARSLVVSLRMHLLQAVSQLDEATLQRELGRLGRGGDCVPTRCATTSDLRVQACAHSGCCLRVVVKEYAAALSSTDCSGAWKPSFQRPLRHSQNCWRITIRRQVSLNRLLAIGIKLVKAPSSAQPMWKPSVTSSRAGVTPDAARDT